MREIKMGGSVGLHNQIMLALSERHYSSHAFPASEKKETRPTKTNLKPHQKWHDYWGSIT
jgi:hypothetical protein